MGDEVPSEAPSPAVPVEAPVPQPEPQPQPKPEKKPFRLNKWHVITVALVVIIGVQALLYLSLTLQFNSMDAEHRALVSEHTTMENDYSDLQSSYSSLEASHFALQANMSSLQADYGSLESSYNSLESSYSSLQSSRDSLQTSYDALQSSYSSYTAAYANLRDLINERALQLGVMDFVTPNDPAVNSIVLSVTGGWSDPSDWNEYWSDVKEMYDWVVNNVEYRYDGLAPILPVSPSGSVEYAPEMWQFPGETLDLRQGDCEDMAILLTSMILSYNGGDYWVEVIAITSSTSGHAAVQFPVSGDQLTILDPAGNYYTHDGGGSLSSRDISTEINNWLNYWKPAMGSDVRVDRVFSNTVDRSFTSTSEYTTWMYSR